MSWTDETTERYLQPSPMWLTVARGEIGQKEQLGEKHNPRILEYLQTVGAASTSAALHMIPWAPST